MAQIHTVTGVFVSDVTAREFYDEMQKMRDLVEAKHRNLRETIENRFDTLNAKLDDHARDDLAVANRVLIIETERKKEEQASIRRGGIAGIFAGSAVTALVEFAKHVFK